MAKLLNDKVMGFLRHREMSIVSTIDKRGIPHNSCKGIVHIDSKKNLVYLFDLYRGRTFQNLKSAPHISITCVDEHKFAGFSLKGAAKITKRTKLPPGFLKAWDKKIAGRLTKRLLKEVQGQKGHARHTEALLPDPQYVIEVKVKEVVDLTPHHIKTKQLGG